MILMIKIFILLFIGYHIGIFSIVNKNIYNNLIPVLPYPSNKHENFTLIDASHLSNKEIIELTNKIDSYNPKLFFIDIFHHSKYKIEELKSLPHKKNIYFTLPIGNSLENKIIYFEDGEKILSFFKNINGILGIYNLQNIYKEQFYINHILKKPSLYHLLDINTSKLILNSEYSINYNGNPPFAKVFGTTLLKEKSEEVFKQLILGKVIFLSNINNNYIVSSYNTLFKGSFVHQTHLSFLIKSALYNEWIKKPTLNQYTIFLIFFTIFWVVFAFFFYDQYTQFLFILNVALSFLIYILVLIYLNYLLPVSEMIFILLTLTLLFLRHWQKLKYQEENTLLNRVSKRVQEKTLHKSFFNSDEYWEELMILVNQLFPFHKTILFEKIEGDTRIREVVSMKCSFKDIQEIRRDFTREPYLSAIEYKSLMIPNRPFFEDKNEEENEYITPLMYNNEVVGFWAFTISKEEVSKIKNFTTLINSVATEMSVLLAQRYEFKRKNRLGNILLKLLHIELEDKNHSVFKHHFAVIEKRMLLNETLFNEIDEAIVAYDFFGKVIQINKSMQEIFEKEEVSPYQLNAAQMLSTISTFPVNEATEIVRTVLIENREYKQFINFKKSKKKYLVNIKPVTEKDIDHKFTENYLFQTYGILFGFIDLEFIENRYNIKEQIVEKILEENFNRLNNIEKLMKNNPNSIFMQKLSERIRQISFSYNQLKMLLKQSIESNEDDRYPFDIRNTINSTIKNIQNRYKDRGIEFKINVPKDIPLVLVSINRVDIVFNTLLEFLVEDSQEGIPIEINIEDKKENILIELKSLGYGMPNEKLMSYLMEHKDTPDIYTNLKDAYYEVQKWIGEIYFYSELGEGITISIILRKVKV